MKRLTPFATLAVALCIGTRPAPARDVARDLRRMVGFTIVAANTVAEISENGGDKVVRLSGGFAFKVDGLILDPLVLTDVILFAKPISKELLLRYQGKLPDRLLYSYKLMIDNEVYEVTPQ